MCVGDLDYRLGTKDPLHQEPIHAALKVPQPNKKSAAKKKWWAEKKERLACQCLDKAQK